MTIIRDAIPDENNLKIARMTGSTDGFDRLLFFICIIYYTRY